MQWLSQSILVRMLLHVFIIHNYHVLYIYLYDIFEQSGLLASNAHHRAEWWSQWIARVSRKIDSYNVPKLPSVFYIKTLGAGPNIRIW